MRILLTTDAFPPICGGSGWSTYELARGMRQRGHQVTIVQPVPERTMQPAGYDGFEVIGFPAAAPRVPFVRNYVRNERLYPRFASFIRDVIQRNTIDLVHGQHVLTGPSSVLAARAAGVPSVCTVRDYWPVCYWGDLLQKDEEDGVCPGCSARNMLQCLRPHAGSAWPLGVPAIPYMRANLRLKQRGLRGADVIIAVSRSVANDLRTRAPGFDRARIETIPNAVDVAGVRATAGQFSSPLSVPYALFVGKLSRHKGVDALIDVMQQARLTMPLVAVGDGPDRAALTEAAARAGCDLRVPGWLGREAVFHWLRHARVLVFPSRWPEPLSRVLIEASALGTPVAAMDTGGTSDIIVHEETGLLSRSVQGLAADVTRLAADAELSGRLGAGAAARAESMFDLPVVMQRMERLYTDCLAARHS